MNDDLNAPVIKDGGSGTVSISGVSFSPRSKSATLPSIIIQDRDENDKQVELKLVPEPTISASEALKLTLLIHACSFTGGQFSPYAYVKANNLERHFTFK